MTNTNTARIYLLTLTNGKSATRVCLATGATEDEAVLNAKCRASTSGRRDAQWALKRIEMSWGPGLGAISHEAHAERVAKIDGPMRSGAIDFATLRAATAYAYEIGLR